jgi:hypothetical protein
MRWRLAAPGAVSATAHKLACVVGHLLSSQEPYSESVLAHCDHLATSAPKYDCTNKPPFMAID